METKNLNVTTEATNNLIYKASKTIGKETIYVTIRLNDECKNGHQDFAITGNLYEADKPKTDKYYISGGCIHDEIHKFFPEFDIFINLHLCDYEGIPMYAVENGFYHLRNGFNNTKPEDNNFKNEFIEYYRLTASQFDVLNTSRNKLQYALYLQNLGILDQWKQEANNAIMILESLTGKRFLIDSKKTQFNAPTPEAIQAEKEKEISGYYTPEAEQQRELSKRDEIIKKLEAERDKKINKANDEFTVKKQVLMIGGKKALDNCIYYSHSKQLSFNWRSYDLISTELINKIKAEIILPEGITIK